VPLLLLAASCSDRPQQTASLPADPLPQEESSAPNEKAPELMEVWTASNGQRRIVFEAEATQSDNYWSWGESGDLTFRVTAEMHEYKETPQGDLVRRLGGKANVLIFDPSGKKLVHEAYQLIDLCPT